MTQLNLTEQAEWDDYWSKTKLPMERKKTERTLYMNEILGVFDRYLPRDDGMAYTLPEPATAGGLDDNDR